MIYKNICRVSHSQIDSEKSYLIKVTQEKGPNIYYYIVSYELLDKLSFCPYTRKENYYYIELAEINMTILEASSDTLKESLSDLAVVDQTNELPWKIGNFAMHNHGSVDRVAAQNMSTTNVAREDISRASFMENYRRNNSVTTDEDSPEFPAFFVGLVRGRQNNL